MLDPRQERLGLFFAALCAVNGAFVPAVAKLTTNRGSAVFVAAATTFFAGIFAAALLAWRGLLKQLFAAEQRGGLALIAALGTTGAFVLFYAGAQRSTAVEAVLCLQIEPAYSLAAAWLVLGHRPTARRALATALILLGIGLAVGAGGLRGSRGVWLLLATPLCWQMSHLVVLRRLRGVHPNILTGARYVYGGFFLTLYWLVAEGVTALPPRSDLAALLPWLVFQGIVLSYVGTLFWYQAVTRLDLARTTAIVVPSIPLLSLVATFALLGEVPTSAQWFGLVLVASGVFAFVTAPHAMAERERIPTQTAPLAVGTDGATAGPPAERAQPNAEDSAVPIRSAKFPE